MRKLSIVLLIAAVVSFALKEPALGIFCLILGVAFFFLSGTTQPEKKAETRVQHKRPVPPNDYNRRNIDVPGAPAVDAYAYRGSQEEYFYALLTGAFPDYEIQRGLSLGKGGDCADVAFLMVKDSEPKLAILLGDSNAGKKPLFKNTRYLLEHKGIPVQFYINTFRNKASYVYSRVSDALN